MWRCVFLAIPLFGCSTIHFDVEPATPQRPTLSSDTSTAAHKTVEVESGLSVDPGDGVDLPSSLKLGVGERTELFANWSPYVQEKRHGTNARGSSDLGIGVRHRFLEESGGVPSAAVQLTTKLPTASTRKGLGSGETDFFAAGILTKTIEKGTVTAFYELGFLGDPRGPGTDAQHSIAVAAGYPIVERLSGFAELASVFENQRDTEAVFSTLGVAYPVGKSTIFDLATVVGLSDDAPDFQVVLGVTMNFGDILETLVLGDE